MKLQKEETRVQILVLAMTLFHFGKMTKIKVCLPQVTFREKMEKIKQKKYLFPAASKDKIVRKRKRSPGKGIKKKKCHQAQTSSLIPKGVQRRRALMENQITRVDPFLGSLHKRVGSQNKG